MKAVLQARRSLPGFEAGSVGGGATNASCSCSADRPVDLVHLSKYTLGDASLEGELLRLFQTQAVLYRDRLEQAVDPKDWSDAAHSLKGSARAIGAWALGDMAAQAEKISITQPSARAEALKGLCEGVAGVNQFIGELLDS